MNRPLSRAEVSYLSGRKTPREPFPPVLASAVRAALDRVLRSEDFRASPRNRSFLRRVVEAELSGSGHAINGFVIGSEVFGRGDGFDHVKDPIVRIEATKLRRDLERYYLTSGCREKVRITIPKGGYRPVFEMRDENDPPADPPPDPVLDATGLTVASLRLGDGPLSAMQPSLRARIADALARLGDLAVYVSSEQDVALLDSEAVRRTARNNGTGFVLSGDAWSDSDRHLIVVRLHDGVTGRLLWSEEFVQDPLSVVEVVTRNVCAARRRFAVPAATGADD